MDEISLAHVKCSENPAELLGFPQAFIARANVTRTLRLKSFDLMSFRVPNNATRAPIGFGRPRYYIHGRCPDYSRLLRSMGLETLGEPRSCLRSDVPTARAMGPALNLTWPRLADRGQNPCAIGSPGRGGAETCFAPSLPLGGIAMSRAQQNFHCHVERLGRLASFAMKTVEAKTE